MPQPHPSQRYSADDDDWCLHYVDDFGARQALEMMRHELAGGESYIAGMRVQYCTPIKQVVSSAAAVSGARFATVSDWLIWLNEQVLPALLAVLLQASVIHLSSDSIACAPLSKSLIVLHGNACRH